MKVGAIFGVVISTCQRVRRGKAGNMRMRKPSLIIWLYISTIRYMTNQFGDGAIPPAPELLTFFKALSDKTRLVMVGLLAKQSLTGEQLASILGIKPATVSHHLARLAEASLVDVEGQR